MKMIEAPPEKYYKRDFWVQENIKYAEPHFRMSKCGRLVNKIAGEKPCELLDVGCGPATLKQLLCRNINYHGIDIAIHRPEPCLIESDFTVNPIKFGNKRFDVVVAQGVFEYLGDFQAQKFAEIRDILKSSGTFLVSYVNFDHLNRCVYQPYNNVQSYNRFRESLNRYFQIRRTLPTSHRWHHDEPRGRIIKAVQMHMNIKVPFLSSRFAVEYFFVCSPRMI